jgi:NADH:ubiquinone oxidoreductase subunit E
MSQISHDDQLKFEKLKAVIEQQRDQHGNIMSVMQEAQNIFGYLSKEVQKFIAEGLHVPLTDIYGVATFYTQFSLEPKGRFQIGVCMGTACYVRGSQKILDALVKELNVEVNATTPDGLFTLEATRCLGCCGLAPVLMIGDDVYGRLDEGKIPSIVQGYRNKEFCTH